MSLRLAMRSNAVLGVLAVAAFAVALGVSNRQRLPALGSAIIDHASAASERARLPSGREQMPAGSVANEHALLQARSQTPAQGLARAAAAPAAPHREQLQTIARLSEQVMPREETTAEEAEERGNAIRQLATLPGPQAAQALVHAIRNDVDPRNRILAVEALRRAGANGDTGWAIRDALREASSSSDEVVAAQARAAYDELVGKLGTQR